MADNLRTRIIGVLYDYGQRPADTAARLADALIHELNLTEFAGVIVGCIHE